RVDELLLGFRVDPVRHGFRLLPVEADAVHQLDQPGTAIVEPEPLQDELPDLGGRRRQHPRRPGAQFVDLEGRQPSCSALQVEQDERLDAAFLEFLDPDADGRIVDEQRLGNRGEGPASVEQQNGVRPAGDAILLQPVPGNRHKVGPIRCTEEIAVRLHQASGIDPADSVKRFPKERGIPLYPKCKANFHAVGCCVCSPDCPSDMTDIGVSCAKESYGRGAGKPLEMGTCAPGLQKDPSGALCYPACKGDFHMVGPVCWQNCPAQQPTDCAAGCSTDSKACASAVVNQSISPIMMAVSLIPIAGEISDAAKAAKGAATSRR